MKIQTTENNLRDFGNKFEDLAADYLIEKGYQIIKKHFTFGKSGEIDLIAEFKSVLIFIEVKGRRSYEYGAPEQSITPQKIKHLRRAAEGYLYVNGIMDKECRIDFIGIDLRGEKPIFNHIENAF
jgi:putative endonuclease